MTDVSFNGWANYETWLVKLWIDNDHGLGAIVQEWAKSFYFDSDYPEPDLTQALKNWIEVESNECLPSHGLYSDLLSASIQKVNWDELARSFLAETAEEMRQT